MGLARLSIAALAITLGLGLLIVGGTMLWGAWTKGTSKSQAASSPTGSPSSASASTAPRSSSAPRDHPAGNTVVIQCLTAQCPVFVAGPGPTDVQFNGKLSRDERRIFRETRLTVAVDDASTVIVTVNGHRQPKGRPGQPRTYTVPPAR
jgi:cytoskeletal protein RodZ